jgi:hypothetical protein
LGITILFLEVEFSRVLFQSYNPRLHDGFRRLNLPKIEFTLKITLAILIWAVYILFCGLGLKSGKRSFPCNTGLSLPLSSAGLAGSPAKNRPSHSPKGTTNDRHIPLAADVRRRLLA